MQAAALPYILAAAGTAASVAADHRADKDRRTILNRAMDGNDKRQEQATAATIAEAQKMNGQQRLDAMQQQEQTALAQALSDIGGTPQTGAGAAIIDTAGGEGAVSGDFVKAKADRALSEGDRLTAVARELSKVRAPGQLTEEEGLRRSDLLENLSSQASDSRGRASAASMDAQGVEAPWWGTVGKIAASVGGAGIGGGAGLAAGGATQVYQQSAAKQRLGAQPDAGFWGGQGARIRFGGT